MQKFVNEVDENLEMNVISIAGGGGSDKTGDYVDISSSLISILKIAIRKKSSNLYTEFLAGLKLHLQETYKLSVPNDGEILNKTFAKLTELEKIDFIKSVYKNAKGLLKINMKDLGQKKKRPSIPGENKRDARWWRSIIDTISSHMESLLRHQDELYYDEIDISNLATAESEDLFTHIVQTFPENPLMLEGITQLIKKYQSLFIKALSTDEMMPVVLGSLLGNFDIETELKSAWVNIKIHNNISDNKWDDFLFTQLKFLNTRLGFRVISRAQAISRYFNDSTKHYVIEEFENGNNYGSVFSLEQSIDLDFENTSARPYMTINVVDDIHFIPQFVCFDAYCKEIRSHPSNSICSRINGAYMEVSQNDRILKTEVYWRGDDKIENQKVYLAPYYEQVEGVENMWFDSITGLKISLPFFFNSDMPATIGSVGTASLVSTYGHPYTDGISKEDLSTVEYSPMLKIISCNRDKTDAKCKYENNIKEIQSKNKIPTSERKAKQALSNKTCTKEEYLGTCILYHFCSTWHLHLRPAERFLQYLCILGSWLKGMSISEMNTYLKNLIGTNLDILFNPKYGFKPIVAVRGDIIAKLIPKLNELIAWIIGDDPRIGPEMREALFFMSKCVSNIYYIWTETADLVNDEIDLRCQLLEHYAINFPEHGKLIFETSFETISLRIISDIAPGWLKVSHKIGNGLMSICEGVGEKKHISIAA